MTTISQTCGYFSLTSQRGSRPCTRIMNLLSVPANLCLCSSSLGFCILYFPVTPQDPHRNFNWWIILLFDSQNELFNCHYKTPVMDHNDIRNCWTEKATLLNMLALGTHFYHSFVSAALTLGSHRVKISCWLQKLIYTDNICFHQLNWQVIPYDCISLNEKVLPCNNYGSSPLLEFVIDPG